MKSVLTKLFRNVGTRKAKKDRARPRIVLDDNSIKLYAIGDVHGCYGLQKQIEKRIIEDSMQRPGETIIIYLGDLVDRGDQSAEVIDYCLAPMPKGFSRICLCGNHDQAFCEFLCKPSMKSDWLEFGGMKTLESYGIDIPHLKRMGIKDKDFAELISVSIPQEHIAFLENMPVLVSSPFVYFVHAGLRPGIPIEEQNDFDIMWIRKEFLIDRQASDRLIVHGHTPSKEPIIGPGRIGIDTAAFAEGLLTAIRIDENGYSFLAASLN